MSGYDPTTGAYHVYHDDTSTEPVSSTVVRAILTMTGQEPTSSRPLAESVDFDAMDSLFGGGWVTGDPDDQLSFTHEGCHITVYGDGHVVVHPPTETSAVPGP